MANYAVAGNYELGAGGTIPLQLIPGPPPAAMVTTRTLRIGTRHFTVHAGLRITEDQAPGLHAQAPGGLVAEVVPNPSDLSILGLNNVSRSSWEVVSANGNRYTIQPYQTVRLNAGTRINFGAVDGEIR